MKKYVIFILVLLLTLSSVIAAPVLTVVQDSLDILGPENSIRSNQITIRNDGDSVLNNIIFTHNIQLSDGTQTIDLTFNPTSIPSLAVGATQTVTLTANLPDNIDIDVYSGQVNVSSGTTQDNFNLNIIVTPEICEDGPQGTDLSLTIDSPDEGDKFKPGETLSLTIEAINDGSEDLKVIVEAILYNMDKGKKIASVESDEIKVDQDDSEDFDLEMLIPTDTKYLKDGDTYYLFVKAYEKGDEDKNCNEEFIELELELEDEDVVIESVLFTPSTLLCGDLVTANIKVRNIGLDSLDDVRIEFINSDLDVNKISDFFDLDEYDEYDDSDYTSRINFNIPEDAQEKTYEFLDINVLFEGETSGVDRLLRDNLPKLTVSGCEEETVVTTQTTTVSQASLSVTPASTSVAVGSNLILNYALTNPTAETAQYSVEFIPNGNWANTVSQTVLVGSKQTHTGTLTIMTNNVAESSYSGIVSVKSGSNIIESKTINIELVNPNQITGRATLVEKSLLDNLKIGNIPIAFWIIADLILAFIILALVYIVYRR